ncbi:hypothetical protein LCGC14_0428140 [marine sediment metagenome]|uniref:Uncharacterized protein n=1 Tax=marine sediment metagenome TaxID=412755 RepID=A0A0F9SUU5_9ZZZZ
MLEKRYRSKPSVKGLLPSSQRHGGKQIQNGTERITKNTILRGGAKQQMSDTLTPPKGKKPCVETGGLADSENGLLGN